jgi:cellulose synthase/poly-beta-1,6-N-acetylglucosamine synthase-like glycosyltransferase
MPLSISIGIMAYNEESNLGRLLTAVIGERFPDGMLSEVIIVASGCTDRTEEISRAFVRRDRRVRLLVQDRREGKASAINLFLANARGSLLILESGDTVPEVGALSKLVAPFADPRVGMTGARPIPVNDASTFMGYTVQLMWRLHHQIALRHPKLGEVVAFRNIVSGIPRDTAVDEASIEAIITGAGLELRYVSEAIVRNKGPENVRDFLKQRRRIAAGHLYLMRGHAYTVSTTDPVNILRILRREQGWTPREMMWTLGAIGLEMIGRMLGCYDVVVRRKNPFIWDVAASTKTWAGDDPAPV